MEIWTFLRRLGFMCQKELLTTLKDKRIRAIMVVPVLIQGFVFGYAANYNLEKAAYAVVDLSHSKESADLLSHIEAAPVFSRVCVLGNSTEIADYIDREEILFAVVIPVDFADRFHKGENAPVQLIVDGRNTMIAGQASGYMTRIVNAWNLEQNGRTPIAVETRTWYNPNQITQWNFMPALIGMIAFVQVVMLAGLSIAKEREQGTFDQLLVSPLAPVQILIGKAVIPLVIGLVQSMMLFCICYFWFEVPFAGSLVTLILVLFLFMLSTVGMALSISAVARSMQQVLVMVFVIIMPMVLLSGLTTPINNMPEVLQYMTYADPLRFAIDAVRRIYLAGAQLKELWEDVIPLMLMACFMLPLATWLFRHKTM